MTIDAAVARESKAISLAKLGLFGWTVFTLFAPDPDAMNVNEMQRLVQHCNSRPTTVEETGKIFFKHPLSKDSIIGFKALTLLHTLLQQGPAKATARAVTHDRFLR